MNVLNKVKIFINDVNNVSIKTSINTKKNKLFVSVSQDIAITPDGSIIVAVNTTSGYKFFQLPKFSPNYMGHRKVYQKYV